MARKDFAMISTTLPYSHKYRAGSVLSKLVYNHLHISASMNYLGVFQYQDVILAHEIDISVSELEAALNELVSNGLVEMHKEYEIIRIIGWFNKANGVTNAKHAIGVIRDFESIDIPDCITLYNSVSEFAVATLKRGVKWHKDADNLRSELKPFLNGFLRDSGAEFAKAMLFQIESVGASLKSEVHSLIPSVLEYQDNTLSIPYAYNKTTLHLNNTNTKTDTKTNTVEVLENDGSKQLDQNQDPKVEVFRKSEVKFKQPHSLPSEALKNSALVRGIRQ